MYCNKENINMLTALLVKHGVTQCVVCPGSRNAPIVHNLDACPEIQCYGVTDERSAAFFALGLIMATRRPAAVCVTSGSALLNVAPAVAEAAYQHLPLLVISADRPQAWIDQLDGQTLPQPPLLSSLVAYVAALNEPHDNTTRWQCCRLINEALMALWPTGDAPSDNDGCFGAPVHINVPISEPLFRFDQPSLPAVRMVRRHGTLAESLPCDIMQRLTASRRPLMVIGQCRLHLSAEEQKAVDELCALMPVLAEPLTDAVPMPCYAEEWVTDNQEWHPDFIMYIGGAVVSKKIKQYLRSQRDAYTVMIHPMGRLEDVTMHADEVVAMDWRQALLLTARAMADRQGQEAFPSLPTVTDRPVDNTPSTFSTDFVVAYLEEQLYDLDCTCHVHYANSSVVRSACRFAHHHVYCNRGVNGIEGSLSVAVGHAAALAAEGSDDKVILVTGDLSFFYDQNALWNDHLSGHLRVVLINDGGGSIFATIPGLAGSQAYPKLVCGAHHTSARGICTQCDVGYLHADDADSLRMAMITMLTEETTRPIVLEVMMTKDN